MGSFIVVRRKAIYWHCKGAPVDTAASRVSALDQPYAIASFQQWLVDCMLKAAT
jgi:hypothetical protein